MVLWEGWLSLFGIHSSSCWWFLLVRLCKSFPHFESHRQQQILFVTTNGVKALMRLFDSFPSWYRKDYTELCRMIKISMKCKWVGREPSRWLRDNLEDRNWKNTFGTCCEVSGGAGLQYLKWSHICRASGYNLTCYRLFMSGMARRHFLLSNSNGFSKTRRWDLG